MPREVTETVVESPPAAPDPGAVYDRYRTAGFGDTEERAANEGYEELVRWLPGKDASILDLGCGGGEFLSFLTARGYRHLRGTDASPEQVQRCLERGLQHVSVVRDWRTYFAASSAPKFDCIVLNHVLEHIAKPDCLPFLETLRDALTPGGRIIVTVPNAAGAFGAVGRYIDFTHEIGFTERSLTQVLIMAGYSDIEVVGNPVRFAFRPRRAIFWLANRMYLLGQKAVYMAAVGTDAPRILTKLLIATGRK